MATGVMLGSALTEIRRAAPPFIRMPTFVKMLLSFGMSTDRSETTDEVLPTNSTRSVPTGFVSVVVPAPEPMICTGLKPVT